MAEENLQCVIEEENKWISVTTTTLTTEVESVICPINPPVINNLFGGLVLFWFFEVMTKHKFEKISDRTG